MAEIDMVCRRSRVRVRTLVWGPHLQHQRDVSNRRIVKDLHSPLRDELRLTSELAPAASLSMIAALAAFANSSGDGAFAIRCANASSGGCGMISGHRCVTGRP